MNREKKNSVLNRHLNRAETLRCGSGEYYNCAQSVLITFAWECGISEKKAAQLGILFGSGMKMGGCCGAITGGLMAIGMMGGGEKEYRSFMSAMRGQHDNLVNCSDLLRRNAQCGGDMEEHCNGMVYAAVEGVIDAMYEPHQFYGWEKADVPALNPDYPSIRTPGDLYDALSQAWCEETCAPRMRDGWDWKNRTLGQCSITAFLAQDIFGGKVYGILRPDGSFHCYNAVGKCCFDLTSEQFGKEAKNLDYRDNPEQFREEHFKKEEKRERYELLKRRLKAVLSECD